MPKLSPLLAGCLDGDTAQGWGETDPPPAFHGWGEAAVGGGTAGGAPHGSFNAPIPK